MQRVRAEARAMVGSAVAITVLSRFCISSAHATMSAVSRMRRGPATGAGEGGGGAGGGVWLRAQGMQDGAAGGAARFERPCASAASFSGKVWLTWIFTAPDLHDVERSRGEPPGRRALAV